MTSRDERPRGDRGYASDLERNGGARHLPIRPHVFAHHRTVCHDARLKLLSGGALIRPPHLPIAVPDLLLLQAGARNPRTGAIQSLRLIEALAVDVAKRKVRQVEILHLPGVARLLVAADRLAKERQLEAEAVSVGCLEIAGALLALVIDRRRELGLLRFLGAGTWQIRNLIVFEAGLIGLLSNLAGLALGVVLSMLLILVINKQSFGWTIRFHWPIAVLLGALTLVYAATVLAGFYPARVAARLNPIEVVHEE